MTDQASRIQFINKQSENDKIQITLDIYTKNTKNIDKKLQIVNNSN